MASGSGVARGAPLFAAFNSRFRTGTIVNMAAPKGRISRRTLLLSCAAARLGAEALKGTGFPSEWKRFADASTEFEFYRLTDPAYSSALPAYYNRAIAKSSGWLIFTCDRDGSLQAYRMDLKSGETRELTQAGNIDAASLALLPDDRSFFYCAGRDAFVSTLANLKERRVYSTPEGWERCPGGSINAAGNQALVVEAQGERSRLRMVPLSGSSPRTVVEAPFRISDPIARPKNGLQILYREGAAALWLTTPDGKQNARLPLAPGGIGPANWSADGDTVLYLSFPEDRSQLNTIREFDPETKTDKVVMKTSQFAHFGFNKNASVFVGASRNVASPYIVLQVRFGGAELTVCEHKASRPEMTAPVFSPDAQRIFFQSDRAGKPSIYMMNVERLVEKIVEDKP